MDRINNYNDNQRLEQAISDGCRGACWDILRRRVAERARETWRWPTTVNASGASVRCPLPSRCAMVPVCGHSPHIGSVRSISRQLILDPYHTSSQLYTVSGICRSLRKVPPSILTAWAWDEEKLQVAAVRIVAPCGLPAQGTKGRKEDLRAPVPKEERNRGGHSTVSSNVDPCSA